MAVGALLVVIVALTSVLAYALGGRPGLSRLGAAVVVLVEIVGATALFLVANVVVGLALILVARRLTPYYTSLYDAADVTLLVLSLFQAITLEACRHLRPVYRR